ncbi:MAG: hypothetical protein FJ320_12625 [SAR202 cluster bacterium]|nr:hypothetical protein [SAR202 cluster bacterium]
MEPRKVMLEAYKGPWDVGDKDANFKSEVAMYSAIDPMPTLDRMASNMRIPVGALVRFVLVKWATSGSEGLMEIGPRVVRMMGDAVEKAEAKGTEEARLEAYQKLSQMISWLKYPLDNPKGRQGRA